MEAQLEQREQSTEFYTAAKIASGSALIGLIGALGVAFHLKSGRQKPPDEGGWVDLATVTEGWPAEEQTPEQAALEVELHKELDIPPAAEKPLWRRVIRHLL